MSASWRSVSLPCFTIRYKIYLYVSFFTLRNIRILNGKSQQKIKNNQYEKNVCDSLYSPFKIKNIECYKFN